jgi:hypothetical protein
MCGSTSSKGYMGESKIEEQNRKEKQTVNKKGSLQRPVRGILNKIGED